jgi:hypothetical protein
MKTVRIKPSKTISMLAVISGIGMVFVGIFGLFPHNQLFGIIWVLASLAVIVFHAINAFTEHGVATEEIDVENKKVELSFDEKLRRLESLRREKLISEREYQHQRKKLLS